MATATKFNTLGERLAEGVFNLESHTFKAMLVNSPAPAATDAVKADLTEISPGNGYTAGGATLSITSSSQSGGLYKWIVVDFVISASGGSIGPLRYPTIYDDTPSSPADPLMLFYDYGGSISLNVGETLTGDFDGTNGLIQI